jgi:membrane protein
MGIVFEVEGRRPYLRGKALDILLVLGLGALITVSVGGTLLINLAEGAKDDLGVFGDAIGGVLGTITGLIPITMTATVFAAVLVVLPARELRLAQVWPAVAVGTAGFELAKRAFSLYLDSFSNYSAVYGSMGAVVAFMVFVYLSSLVLLAAAELAATRAMGLDERPAISA